MMSLGTRVIVFNADEGLLGYVEVDREGMKFLYNGVRRLKQYLTVTLVVMILGFILAIILVLAIPRI
jgi:sensor histidine kinase regulating citrate/malate metabolism